MEGFCLGCGEYVGADYQSPRDGSWGHTRVIILSSGPERELCGPVKGTLPATKPSQPLPEETDDA